MKLRRDQRAEMLRNHVTVYEWPFEPRERLRVGKSTSRLKQPECRAKATIIGYAQSKYLDLTASGSHEF